MGRFDDGYNSQLGIILKKEDGSREVSRIQVWIEEAEKARRAAKALDWVRGQEGQRQE